MSPRTCSKVGGRLLRQSRRSVSARQTTRSPKTRSAPQALPGHTPYHQTGPPNTNTVVLTTQVSVSNQRLRPSGAGRRKSGWPSCATRRSRWDSLSVLGKSTRAPMDSPDCGGVDAMRVDRRGLRGYDPAGLARKACYPCVCGHFD